MKRINEYISFAVYILSSCCTFHQKILEIPGLPKYNEMTGHTFSSLVKLFKPDFVCIKTYT